MFSVFFNGLIIRTSNCSSALYPLPRKANMEPTFNDVDDTLIFRTKVAELETESRKLGDRSQAMLKGYKQYKDSLKEFLDHTYDSLSMQWNEGLLSSIRDTHKQYEKRQTDMEDLQAKHLGTTRKPVERKRRDIGGPRKMNEMQARRKYSFIKALHGTAINHKRAYTDALAALGANDHSLDAMGIRLFALEIGGRI
eukprot:gene21097-27984_t